MRSVNKRQESTRLTATAIVNQSKGAYSSVSECVLGRKTIFGKVKHDWTSTQQTCWPSIRCEKYNWLWKLVIKYIAWWTKNNARINVSNAGYSVTVTRHQLREPPRFFRSVAPRWKPTSGNMSLKSLLCFSPFPQLKMARIFPSVPAFF